MMILTDLRERVLVDAGANSEWIPVSGHRIEYTTIYSLWDYTQFAVF